MTIINRRSFFRLGAVGAALSSLAGINQGKTANFRIPTRRTLQRRKADPSSFRSSSIKGYEFIDLSGDEAVVCGYPLSWWDNQYELPIHLHFALRIRKNVRDFQSVFKTYYPKGEIRFAAKANPHPAIFKVVVSEGEGIDAASAFEVDGALLAGVDPRFVDVNGNAKTNELIRLAISRDMVLISDSIPELRLINHYAREQSRRPRVLQRLSGFPISGVTSPSSFTCGKWTKFGMDISEMSLLMNEVTKSDNIDFQGFHVHIGSQIATLDPYQVVAAKLIDFTRALAERGKQCKMLNIGGGFPVNYVNKQQWEDILRLIQAGYKAYIQGDESKLWAWESNVGGFLDEGTCRPNFKNWQGHRFYSDYPKQVMLSALLQSELSINGRSVSFAKALKEIGEPTLVIEPGRALVEDCGVTLSRVGMVKRMADGLHNLVALEAGIVNFGDALEEVPMNRWQLASGLNNITKGPYDAFLAGHLCFTGDMPSKYKIRFDRELNRGDVLFDSRHGCLQRTLLCVQYKCLSAPCKITC